MPQLVPVGQSLKHAGSLPLHDEVEQRWNDGRDQDDRHEHASGHAEGEALEGDEGHPVRGVRKNRGAGCAPAEAGS